MHHYLCGFVIFVQQLKFFLIAILVFILISCMGNTQNQSNELLKKTNLKKAALLNTKLGLSYLNKGDIKRAKQKLLIARKQQPDSIDVNLALAYYFEITGEVKEAKTYYLKSISLSPGNGAPLNNYGAFLCRQGNYKASLGYFLKAVKDQHYLNTAAAYENAGICASEIPDYDASQKYFKKALAHEPNRIKSFYELIRNERKLNYKNNSVNLLKQYPQFSHNPKVKELVNNDVNYKRNKKIALKYSHNNGEQNGDNNHN